MKPRGLAPWISVAAALALLACGSDRIPAVDFVRGDVNGDGVLSMADAYFMVRWLARGGPAPQCRNASDFYDEGIVFGTGDGRTEVNLIHLAGFTVVEYDVPTAPFPEPGPDPTPNSDPTLTCEAYGGGSPLEDEDRRRLHARIARALASGASGEGGPSIGSKSTPGPGTPASCGTCSPACALNARGKSARRP